MRIFKPAVPRLLLGVLDGGSLEMRILRLIDARLPWARRYRVLSAVGCLLVLGVLSAGVVMIGVRPSAAQSADVKVPAYEVVSIKQDELDGPFEINYMADRLLAVNVPLQAILRNAYGDAANRIVGLPGWVGSERYDIEAKVAGSDVTAYQKLTPEQRRLMLQVVLVDRFKLKTHFETIEFPEYALVVMKNGPKLKEAKAGDAYPNGPKNPDGSPIGSGMFWSVRSPSIGQGVSMEELARTLGGPQSGQAVDRPVVDKTGLTGRYDFTLEFARETPGGASLSGASGPSIFAAIQEQLGLKLEPTKGPMKTLVIDHIERPSAN